MPGSGASLIALTGVLGRSRGSAAKEAIANVKDGRPHELMQAIAAIVGIDLGTVAAGRRDIGCTTELVEPGSAIKLGAG